MIPLFKVFMSDDVLLPLNNILMSGYITQGNIVDEFENKLKEYIDNPYVLTLNSATSGLTIALRLLKNPDPLNNWNGFNIETDVVLTPVLTCFATTAAILANNVNIRWIDVDLNTANIDLDDLKNKLNYNTKVIYILHWGGNPVDLDKLEDIKNYCFDKYGFKPIIVEDCAHSFGAVYDKNKIGNSNNICVFSLQAIKLLTSGDGGIITFPNKELYDRCKLMRWFGIDRDQRNYNKNDFRLENDILEYGYKFHMNDINATIGLFNLKYIDKLLSKNRENAQYYDNKFKDIDGIKIISTNKKSIPSYWLYTIRVRDKLNFIDKMKKANIMTSQVHNRNDIYTCVEKYKENLHNITILEEDLVCIPVGWWLSKQELEYISDTIISIIKK